MKQLYILLTFCFSLFVFNAFGQNKLTSDQIEDFRNQARQKVGQFQNFIISIQDTKRPKPVRQKYVSKAVLLFNKNARIESASVNRNNQITNRDKLTVRAYLNKVLNYGNKYDFVKIQFYQIKLSSIYKEPNGNYKMIATIGQKFSSYNLVDGRKVPRYIDYTEKDIEIKIQKIKTYQGAYYFLLLGDITVEDIIRLRN